MTVAQITNNPYVGPRPFQRDDKDWYFGREREATELEALVITKRCVLFYAQSGAGKSSLINTSLIPALEAEQFEVLPVGRVSGATPPGLEAKNIYILNLILNLNQGDDDPQHFVDMPLNRFLNFLVREPVKEQPHKFYYDEAYTPTEILPRVLIIDQFEELFTTYPQAWQQREEFFYQLHQAMRDDPFLAIVLSIREDFVARLDPYAHLVAGNLRDRFYMQRMEKAAAKRAIMRPAARAGREFTPETADQLVKNLSYIRVQTAKEEKQNVEGQFVEPVQLQVVCQQIWDSLKMTPLKPIEVEDLQALAEERDLQKFIDNSLGEFYKRAIKRILNELEFEVTEIELREWFTTRLITEGQTRGTVHRGPEKTAGLANNVVDFLTTKLFLLRAESRAGATWYELTHDRFIEPILKANREWWAEQSPVFQAAKEWDQANRARHHLYVGQQLKNALNTVNLETAEPIVQTFLRESKKADKDLEAQAIANKRLRRFTGCAVMLLGAVALYILPLLACSALLGALLISDLSGDNLYDSENLLILLLVVIGGSFIVFGPGIIGASIGKSGVDMYRFLFERNKKTNDYLEIFTEKLKLEQSLLERKRHDSTNRNQPTSIL